MEHLSYNECVRLHASGVKPDTALVWVNLFPSYPMYQPWPLPRAVSAGLTGPHFNLVPVYTTNAKGTPCRPQRPAPSCSPV